MGDDGAHHAAGDLNHHVRDCVGRRQVATDRKGQRHGRVEVRPRHGPQDRDQHDQDRPGRKGIAQQGDRRVVGKGLGHDAGPDDSGDEEGRANSFGEVPPNVIKGHGVP